MDQNEAIKKLEVSSLVTKELEPAIDTLIKSYNAKRLKSLGYHVGMEVTWYIGNLGSAQQILKTERNKKIKIILTIGLAITSIIVVAYLYGVRN